MDWRTIKYELLLTARQHQWRRKNLNNRTVMGSVFDVGKVTVGKNTYGILNIYCESSENVRLEIGSYCSIAPEVEFLLGEEHTVHTISTFPFKNHLLRTNEAGSKGSIIIKDDVWIGRRSTILSGFTIGQGAIIAAGAVVTKDIPPYSVWGGGTSKTNRYKILSTTDIKTGWNRYS